MSYYQTLSLKTESGTYRVVNCRFESSEHQESLEDDYYEECRDALQEWLNRHFPGEEIDTTGTDIVTSGEDSDFPNDIVSFVKNEIELSS